MTKDRRKICRVGPHDLQPFGTHVPFQGSPVKITPKNRHRLMFHYPFSHTPKNYLFEVLSSMSTHD